MDDIRLAGLSMPPIPVNGIRVPGLPMPPVSVDGTRIAGVPVVHVSRIRDRSTMSLGA